MADRDENLNENRDENRDENREENRDNSYHFTESTPEEKAIYARQAAEMTRAYRVRGRMIPLLGLLTSLLFVLLVPFFYGAVPEDMNPPTMVIAGVLVSLVAIPLHLLGGAEGRIRAGWLRSLFYPGAILINTAGTSLCMTAYYRHLGQAPTYAAMLLGVLIPAGLFGLVCLLLQVSPDHYGRWTGLTALLTVALMVAAIVFWVRSDSKVLFSFVFFDLLWTLIALIALHVACSDEESPWLRFSSFAAFGVLMAVGGIVLILLAFAGGDGCDCDCGDGCGDCCDCGDCGCGGTESGKAATKRKK